MKPRLGRTVYTIYDNNITKSKVAYLGKNSFIIEHFITHGYDYGYEYNYNDYEITWFTSLSKAKKNIMDSLTDDEKKDVEWKAWSTKDYWELIYKE